MNLSKILTTVILTTFWLNVLSADFFTSTTNLNVRSGPGTDYSVAFSLKQGEEVKIIDRNNGKWFQIEHNDKRGYAFAKYLEYSRTDQEYIASDEQKEDEKQNMYIVIGIVVGVILLIIVLSISSKSKRNPQPQTNISSQPITQQQSQPRVVVTKSTKSVGLAIFLSIMFPYFGILYSTVSGFFWLFFSYLGMWGLLLYWGFTTLNDGVLYIGFVLSMIHWLISIIWSGIAASNYNQRIISQAQIN